MDTQKISKFIPVWGISLSVIFLVLTGLAAVKIIGVKNDAAARHKARLEQNAVEPGKTAAEEKPPVGSHPRKVKVGINGEHHVVYLVRAEITKFFSADRFPLDDHLLTIGSEDSKLSWTELEFEPDVKNSAISSRVKMPRYKVAQTGMVAKPHAYKTNFGDNTRPEGSHETYSQFVYGVWNVRPGYGTYFKVFVGLYAAALIAMLAFFVKPTDVDPRFGLGVGGFFGAVANTLVTATAVPDSGVMTLLDMVNGFGMVLIFLTLVQSTVTLYLYDILDQKELSQKFDSVSKLVFAGGFIVFNIVVPVVGMTRL